MDSDRREAPDGSGGLQLAAEVLHELRQPLLGIKAYVQMIRDELGSKTSAPVGLLLNQVERMEQIISDFHRLSKDQPSPKQPLLLADCVREAQRQFALTGDNTRVTVETDVDPAAAVVGNARLLEQLIINLLTNARDAMNGLGRIKLVVSADNNAATLCIADWGPGIPAELRQRVFEPYVSSKARGSGLGLAVCKRIATEHSATLDLAPAAALSEQPPPATIFRVRFPAMGPVPTAALPKILLVDDESIIRMVFRDLMAKECVLLEADTAEQGLLLLKDNTVDLIVTDKNLPGLSGLDLALEARKLNPKSKVLLMTGYPSLITAQQAIELGVMEYLLKPFDDIRVVRDTIRRALVSPPPGTFKATNRRVDLFEDNPSSAAHLVEALQTLGMEPNLRGQPTPFVGDPPAGVVMSWDYGPARGVKAVELARQACGGAPFVVLAEHLTMEAALESLRAGASACLPKLMGDLKALSRELARALKL
ncbi:MAG: response regulator [Myxococcaceae bacterium]